MKVVIGDLWDQDGLLVIPTNLSVKKNGSAIMGAGVAAQAVKKYPWLPKRYGELLKGPSDIDDGDPTPGYHRLGHFILFPVKYHWIEKADLHLIETNLRRISQSDGTFFLPLIGCGHGELPEELIGPLLHKYLDDRFTLVLRDEVTAKRHEWSSQARSRTDRSKIWRENEL